MSEVMLKRCIDHLRNHLTDDPLSLMNWVSPPPDISRNCMTYRVAVLCDTATFACSEVNRLTHERDTLTTSLARVTAERDEALKYGAPQNAKSHRRLKPCEHNDYWITHSGNCMACRAVDAETERDEARASLAGAESKVNRLETALHECMDYINDKIDHQTTGEDCCHKCGLVHRAMSALTPPPTKEATDAH